MHHLYPYLAQFSDVNRFTTSIMDQKPGNLAGKIPGTWMLSLCKIWYGLVWYHTVSHGFYPLFFGFQSCDVPQRLNKIVDPQQNVIGLGCEQHGDRIHTIFSPVPQGWLDPNLRCLELGKFQLTLEDPNSPTNAQLRRPAGSEILKVIWNMSLECAAWKESEQILKIYSWIYGLKIL